MRATFRALRSANYRLFFGGQTLSLVGTWMESLAMSWLVYRLTGSEWLLGTVAFSSQIPMFLVSPFAGVITERVDKRRLLIATQCTLGTLSLILSVLVLSGHIQVWHIIVLSVFVGMTNAFDMPARQSLIIQIVEDPADLPNAIALNSTQFNIARLIGPAVAGLTVRVVGEGVCFLINAVSFLAVVGALAAMRIQKPTQIAESPHPLQSLQEGAGYVWNSPPIRGLLLLMAVASFVSGLYTVLLPVYATHNFHGRSDTLGFMYAAVGVGALTAALRLASRTSVLGLTKWIAGASALFAVALAAFAVTPSLFLALVVLAFMGFGAMTHMAGTNTLIQTIVQDQMRGRVMAFYAMSFVGTMPIGSLLAGAISRAIGPTPTLIGGALISLCASLAFIRALPRIRQELRPIYEAKGILAPAT